jgi:hypothetical protein
MDVQTSEVDPKLAPANMTPLRVSASNHGNQTTAV